jgi:hypothetical protein
MQVEGHTESCCGDPQIAAATLDEHLAHNEQLAQAALSGPTAH